MLINRYVIPLVAGTLLSLAACIPSADCSTRSHEERYWHTRSSLQSADKTTLRLEPGDNLSVITNQYGVGWSSPEGLAVLAHVACENPNLVVGPPRYRMFPQGTPIRFPCDGTGGLDMIGTMVHRNALMLKEGEYVVGSQGALPKK